MKNNKGITLIALIITIIVMLILAGVSINMVIGENGVITKAEEAKIIQKKAEIKDKVGLAAGAAIIKGQGKLTWENLQWALDKDNEIKENGLEIVEERNDYYLISNESNLDKEILYEYTVNKSGSVEDELKLIDEESDSKFTATLTSDSEGNLIAIDCQYKDKKYTGQVDFPNYITRDGEKYKVTKLLGHVGYKFSKVTMSKDVTWPGSFKDCINLEEITLGRVETVKEGNVTIQNIFSGCKKLKKVEIRKLTEMQSGMFGGCTSLTEIVLPEGLINIGASAFSGCKNLENIIIPSTVEIINMDAFYNCEKLSSIVIPKSVKKIEDSAFVGCSNLKYIEIQSNERVVLGVKALGNNSSVLKISINADETDIKDWYKDELGNKYTSKYYDKVFDEDDNLVTFE